MEPIIGEIKMFAGSFVPRGWLFCNGQLLSIAEYQALYSILGTIYGGDGRYTFALPDLTGRVPLGSGQSENSTLTPRIPGEIGGAETITLSEEHLPVHTHEASGQIKCNFNPGTPATATSPVNGTFANIANSGSNDVKIYNSASPNNTMAADGVKVDVKNTGSGEAHYNMQPYLAVSFIIAVEGIYPSRY